MQPTLHERSPFDYHWKLLYSQNEIGRNLNLRDALLGSNRLPPTVGRSVARGSRIIWSIILYREPTGPVSHKTGFQFRIKRFVQAAGLWRSIHQYLREVCVFKLRKTHRTTGWPGSFSKSFHFPTRCCRCFAVRRDDKLT